MFFNDTVDKLGVQQTIRYVLGHPRRKRYLRSSLLPSNGRFENYSAVRTATSVPLLCRTLHFACGFYFGGSIGVPRNSAFKAARGKQTLFIALARQV
jgi:hypothetical protein